MHPASRRESTFERAKPLALLLLLGAVVLLQLPAELCHLLLLLDAEHLQGHRSRSGRSADRSG